MSSMLLESIAFTNLDRLDTEDLIVSYLLKSPERISELSDNLHPLCLEITANRTAYIAMLEMVKLSIEIDAVALEIYLDRQNKLNIIGGSTTIAMWAGGSLVAPDATKVSIENAIDHVVEIYKRKSLLKDLGKLQTQLLDLNLTYKELSSYAESYLLEFLRGKKNLKGLESIETTMSDSIEKIIKRSLDRESGNPSESISTGYPDIDRMTGGWQRSDLVVVAGRTSMGKSAFVQNTLLAVSKDRPVAMFSLEMSTQQMNERFISIATGIEASRIRDGLLVQNDYETVLSASERLKQLKYWGCDKSKPTFDFIASECRKLHASEGVLGGIAIDHVGLLIEDHTNTRAEINRITSRCKQLAMELDCPVFLVSQINRGTEGRNDKRPQLADLAESGRLEQDANLVVMLYRDDYYNPGSPDKGIAEIIIRKNRGGECGTTKLVYDANTTTFKNLLKKW
jgi:replicative DNA helicase